MKTDDVIALNNQHLMNTFGVRQISLKRGQGTRVWDQEGNEYLDFLCGIDVNNLGHCHPKIVEAIRKQAGELLHCTNLYYIEPAMRLAKMLCGNSFADRVFFSNSGGEANEAGMKLARKYAKASVAPERTDFITFKNSFHGRTFATVTATGQPKYHAGFEPMFPGISYATFNDLESVKSLISEKTAAIIVEPVQGEGGFLPAEKGFLQGLRALCDENKIVLVFDEIQTGLGRVGRNFAYEYYDVIPDIMTLAKPLGGGLPIGATLAKEHIAAAFTPGSHGGTMGGNPVVTAAALAYCEELFEGGLAQKAAQAAEYWRGKLEELKAKHDCIVEIRGLGLMLAIRLTVDSASLVKTLEKNGLLTGALADNVVRFHPPLNVSREELDEAAAILDKTL
jgi:acetylornithine/N-succinyldiaminopimelate aminotransferase